MPPQNKRGTPNGNDASHVRPRAASPVVASWQARRLLWSIVQATAYRYSFHMWSDWRAFLLRRFGARIGRHCTIRRSSRVYYPWLLEMGDFACLGDSAVVYNLAKVNLGERATVSQEAYLCAGTHDYTQLTMPLVAKAITIGPDTWICARAFVGPGVTVGAGAVVGACAVAMKDVPQWSVVAGNPAVVIKKRPRF